MGSLVCVPFGDLLGVFLAPPPLFLKYFFIIQKINPHDPKECFVKHQREPSVRLEKASRW